MKKRKETIEDIHYDILKEIFIRVARSSDGAKDLANVICVCKTFRQFVEDEDVLRVVAFDNLLLSDRWELFQQREGLINRCAQVGHTEAQFMLAKVILVSTSQLLIAKKEATDLEASYYAQAFSFIENFLLERTYPHTCGFHFDLVRFFLSQARLCQFEDMQPFVVDYVEYFFGSKGHNGENFFLSFNDLCSSTLDHELELSELKFAEYTRRLCLCALKYRMIFGVDAVQLEAWAEEIEKGGRVGNSGSSSSSTMLLEKLDESIKRLRAMATIYERGIQKVVQHFTGNIKIIELCLSLLLEIAEFSASVEDQALILKTKALHLNHMRDNLISEFDALVSKL